MLKNIIKIDRQKDRETERQRDRVTERQKNRKTKKYDKRKDAIRTRDQTCRL